MFFFLTNFSITLFFRIVVEAKKIGFKLYLQKITKNSFREKKMQFGQYELKTTLQAFYFKLPPVCLSVSLRVCLYIYLFCSIVSVCLSAFLPVYLSFLFCCLSVCSVLSFCLSVCLSESLSVCLSEFESERVRE